MSDTDPAKALAALLESRTAKGIAVETSALIRSGTLPVGTKLPTLRALAFELGISPATLSEAWSELRRQKMITGRGRNGAWVSGNVIAPRPARTSGIGKFTRDVLDLTLAVPDPTLLPNLETALAHAASAANLNNYERTPILGELRDAVQPLWPYSAEAFLATNGGYNAVYAALHALVMPGASVAIEDPTAGRLLDILDDLGATTLPVASDGDGPKPDELARVLKQRPMAFVFQPRTHSVTGTTTSRERMRALAEMLETEDVVIIEDDGLGEACGQPSLSLGTYLPDRVVHILSMSKWLGPDLRLAVLSAPLRIVRQIQSYRSFSAGWTSRLLQAAAASLITDPDSVRAVRTARNEYARRRNALADALARVGVNGLEGNGFCLWIPVLSEQYALVTLAAHGIAALPGAKFSNLPTNHIRVATSILTDDFDKVASAIMLAAGAPEEGESGPT